ncbi:DUF7882 family protein [Subtercola sp. YIM 133946]|uniref:DUF7882 family protein n=1 Tax=Subtercola sp. YIM 133946 TaxID=3118909 RepID=UPI002F94C682
MSESTLGDVMGYIRYDGTQVQFDDRLLTHLQIVIVQKFQREQSFLMSWKDSPVTGDGRASIWLTPNIPIYFKFLGGRMPTISRVWLEALATSADSSTGLIVTAEDGRVAYSTSDHDFLGSYS